MSAKKKGGSGKKKGAVLVKLVSTAKLKDKDGVEKATGTFYVTKRNMKNQKGKLAFLKYDPRVREHVLFQEEKLK